MSRWEIKRKLPGEPAQLRAALGQFKFNERDIARDHYGLEDGTPLGIEEMQIRYGFKREELPVVSGYIERKMEHILSHGDAAGCEDPPQTLLDSIKRRWEARKTWITREGERVAIRLTTPDAVVDAVTNKEIRRADALRVLFDRSGHDAVGLSRASGITISAIGDVYKKYDLVRDTTEQSEEKANRVRVSAVRAGLERLGRTLGISEGRIDDFVREFGVVYKSNQGGRRTQKTGQER